MGSDFVELGGERINEVDERAPIAKVAALMWAQEHVSEARTTAGRTAVIAERFVFLPGGRPPCHFESGFDQSTHDCVVGLAELRQTCIA